MRKCETATANVRLREQKKKTCKLKKENETFIYLFIYCCYDSFFRTCEYNRLRGAVDNTHFGFEAQ